MVKRFCPGCGHSYPDIDTCPDCGYKLQSGRKQVIGLIIGLVLTLAVLALLILPQILNQPN